ncbi:MAG: hypothetical protein EHM70_10660 [Chloroflexota bacterium]|nr:MAG: hypothetical protein EHM70_10660 [Chloroflexota bacterium]
MDDLKTLDKRYEALTWGVGFLWIGILGLIPGDQNGLGLLGVGLILLGLNLGRSLSKIPINGYSTALGGLVLILGLVVLLRSALRLPQFELDLFPIVLVAIGLYFLFPGQKWTDNR